MISHRMGKDGKASQRYNNSNQGAEDADKEDIADKVVKRYNATFSVNEENTLSNTVPLEFAELLE